MYLYDLNYLEARFSNFNIWFSFSTVEATGDLIGNKTAGKITLGKTKSEGEDKTNKRQEVYIPPEKIKQIIDDLRLL